MSVNVTLWPIRRDSHDAKPFVPLAVVLIGLIKTP
jgi:hypothetical protein